MNMLFNIVAYMKVKSFWGIGGDEIFCYLLLS